MDDYKTTVKGKGYRRARGVAPVPPGTPPPEDTLSGKTELDAAIAAAELRGWLSGLKKAAQVASLHAERFVEKPASPYYLGRKEAALYLVDAIRALHPDAVRPAA
jgi:hypothetical protein